MKTTQEEETSSFLEENRNEIETDIHIVECKSSQGGCIGKESKDECTSSFIVSDLQTTAKDVDSCKGAETYFLSYPKEVHKSYL